MFSVIIPTYNEKENIKQIIKIIEEIFKGKKFEIIVVDDNSPDGTGEEVKKLQEIYNNIHLIIRKDKRGLSTAVIDGIKEAKYRKIVVMDADLQHPPEVISNILDALDKHDMVIASRYIRGGGMENWSFKRKMISEGANFLAHLAIPESRNIRDVMSGFFGFWKDKVNLKKLDPKGYKIMLEILVKGEFKNIVEIPYTFGIRLSGESKLERNIIVDYIKHIIFLSKYTGYFYTILKFIIVGASGIVVNLGILYFLVSILNFSDLLSVILAIEISIIWNFVFNHIWTFRNRVSGENIFIKFGKFQIVSISGAVINWFSYYVFTRFFNMYYLLSELIAIFIAFIFNFILNDLWTWGVSK